MRVNEYMGIWEDGVEENEREMGCENAEVKDLQFDELRHVYVSCRKSFVLEGRRTDV